MTVRDWIVSRTPPAPPRLQESLFAALGADADADASRATEAFLRTAERQLRSILEARRFDRSGALDLLVVDALTTYAYEHASTAGLDVAGIAADGLHRFGAIAAAHG